jgi:hypothetical protein
MFIVALILYEFNSRLIIGRLQRKILDVGGTRVNVRQVIA